jgi:pimeloyl-ACP methyl ester carboxylesterase
VNKNHKKDKSAMSRQPIHGLLRKTLVWLAKAAVAVIVVAIALVASLLFVMWWEHRSRITLPAPSGHFAVGRTSFAWTNQAETNELAPAPGTKRQVVGWMWYPAVHASADVPADYVSPSWRSAMIERQGSVIMKYFFKRDLSVVRVHSWVDAAVSPAERTYPVVVLRAGGGAPTTDFTTLAEDLASHGYVVVGFDAPYLSGLVVLPDGRVVTRSSAGNIEDAGGNIDDPALGKLLAIWTSNTGFVVDQLQRLNADASGTFAGRMNLGRLGMFGHSFGGATALEFCRQDPRCRAAIDLDGIPFGRVVTEGLGKPGMFLISDHRREMADPVSAQVLGRIQSIYERLPDGRFYGVIRRANHFSFSDQILLNSQAAIRVLRVAGLPGLDGRRGLAISADYVHTFFDVYLKGTPAASLTSLSEKYQEVQIEGR